jgi:hypothetical protein
LDAEVAGGAEAEVAARLDELNVLTLEPHRVAVVDDEDLVGLAPERVEASSQSVVAVVRDDDDGDAQYAPLRASTAGIVFARIETSSQIDQFSR